MTSYVLFTSVVVKGKSQTYAYASSDKALAQAAGERLRNEDATHPSFSVLPVGILSPFQRTPTGVDLFVLYTEQYVASGPAQPHVYLVSDPAAGDALGAAWQKCGKVFTYKIVPLQPGLPE